MAPGRLQTERENWQAQRSEAQEAGRRAARHAATAVTTPTRVHPEDRVAPAPDRGRGHGIGRPRAQAPRAGSFRCFPTAAGHVSIQLSTKATKKCLPG
jgi:hypothetical protein